MDQRVKVRIGNRKVMETKQGSLETKMGRGEIRIGVLVRGYTECNTLTLSGLEYTRPPFSLLWFQPILL